MPEKLTRVGDLIKAGDVTRADVEAMAARLFDGKTTLPMSDGYTVVMPDHAKMTPYSREAIMTAEPEQRP